MRKTVAYPMFRIGGALLAALAAAGWIVEPILNVETPVDTIVNAFAQHGFLLALNIFLLSLACGVLMKRAGFNRVAGTILDGTDLKARCGVPPSSFPHTLEKRGRDAKHHEHRDK